jgi:hypothetical protein
MQKNDMDSSESTGAKSETPNHAFALMSNYPCTFIDSTISNVCLQ